MAAVRLSARRVGAAGLLAALLVWQGLAGLSNADQPSAAVRQTQGPKSPPDPLPPGIDVVTGSERIQWKQDGRSFKAVAAFQYIAYVNDVETPLTGVKCEPRPIKGPFYCTAPLPQLRPGLNTIRIAAVAEHEPSPRSRLVYLFRKE